MMPHSCRDCTDTDCPKRGSDNMACEDFTSDTQPGLEGPEAGTRDQNATSQVAVESRFYVYVAGRLSGPPPEYLANLHDMCAASRRLMEAGYVPINPGADALEGLMSGEVLPKEHYQRRSLHLLRLLAGKRAALYVVNLQHPDGTPSSGTVREIDEARRLDMPVVWSMEELAQLRGSEL